MTASARKTRFTRAGALFVLAMAACLVLLSNGGQAQAGAPSVAANTGTSTRYIGKVERRVYNDTASGQSTQFMVLLSQQADLSAAYGMKDQDARGWYVYDTLTTFADKTQVPVRQALDRMGAAYQPYWVANAILVSGNRSVVDALAAMPEVGTIESNDSFKGIDDPVMAPNAPVSESSGQPATVEWGVQNVNAPQVWAMGYTGQGIVIANQDTGMRWTHNAIKPHYRGWNGSTADHNYNWHDAIHDSTGNPCGNDSQQPCDDNAHGTHTTGTTNGDDGAGNQIGVAPGAKWIGCRNMDQGNGTPARYTECFQFFIAPTDLNGQNPNPSLRPHVMNNSWGCPASEGCAPLTLETIVENTQAAGIFVEASAGNSGPGCGSVSDPPANYGAAFSTGAINSSNTLASFSSRGPGNTTNLLKPNISAPGVNVRSSINTSDTSYANFQGTSMAGPHVVGVVALLWSAHPELSRMITETKTLLQNTANPNVVLTPVQTCGGTPSSQIPNNSFGYGRIDALAAVNAAGGATATPTTAASTSTATQVANTPTATATQCSGAAGTWTQVANISDLRARAVGVNWTATNSIYVFGGRNSNSVYGQDIFKYDIAADSWTTLTQQLPDAMTSNMVGGVLTFPEGPRIFIVGGNGAGSVYTGRTLAFNPADNTFTTKATWPAAPLRLPGGAAVVNNKFYVFGGIDVNTQGYTDIYMYDPTADSWSLVPANLSVPRGYIATELMPGGLVYLAGGSQPDGSGGLTDETVFESFNPVNNNVQSGPPLPIGTSNNQGYNINNKFYVPAGGFNATVPTVQVFDPATQTWGTDTDALFPVRNYAKGYGPNGSIFVIGGIDDAQSFVNYTQKFTPGGGSCGSPTATATATTPAGSPTATATACTINFSDVHPTDYFYNDVRCVYCLGAVSGYADGTFRPFNNTTRGQMTKIVVLGLQIPIFAPTGTPTFSDVPPTDPFYQYIETAAHDQIVSGYADGTFRPNNNVTRGQLSKIVVQAAVFMFSWPLLNPQTGRFSDVPPGSPFYQYIETAACHGVISGYSDGTFRPGNNAIRAQISKIVCNTSQNPQDTCSGSLTFSLTGK